MLIVIKLTGAIPLLILYSLCACLVAVLPAGPRLRRVYLAGTVSFFSRIMLQLLGIRPRVKHRERLTRSGEGRLIVANHLSYIDVLVIASVAPVVFITSVELGGTPLLGMLARLGGSLFVERRKASGLKREIDAISRELRYGVPVVLFPEGTTSNGDRVHPFKRSLFDAAIVTGADVLPLCLRYTRVNGEAVTPANRDSVFYHGGVSFFAHLPRLLAQRSVDVDVVLQKLIHTRRYASRKDLASAAYEAVTSAYHGGA